MHSSLLLASSDMAIFCMMALALAGTVLLILWASLVFVRIGCGLCCGAVWLGLANFGYRPFVGGGHSPDAYFGCTLVVIGVVGMAVCCAVDEAVRAIARPAAGPAGFPVLPPGSTDR